jgi:hypothetical protein
MISCLFSNTYSDNKTPVDSKNAEKETTKVDIPSTDVYQNATQSNQKTVCPMSSYKQCSNNFNDFRPIINSTQFPKPEKDNRVNMYNTVS